MLRDRACMPMGMGVWASIRFPSQLIIISSSIIVIMIVSSRETLSRWTGIMGGHRDWTLFAVRRAAV